MDIIPLRTRTGRVTPEQLGSYIQLFKKKFDALESHCGILQIALAVVQTLKDPQNAKWDNFLAFERLFVQNIGESTFFNALNQLLPIIKSYNNRTDNNDYTPQELLLLLVYIYSIVGEVKLGKELSEAESQVKEALVQAICDEPELPTLLQKIIANPVLQNRLGTLGPNRWGQSHSRLSRTIGTEQDTTSDYIISYSMLHGLSGWRSSYQCKRENTTYHMEHLKLSLGCPATG
ncbi:sec1 family domain-containing protein 2-like [Python bivittatus]|uniref:Sec1 family domain-containing protein 2-like n=1 Tax=Python bivittatus TaxID=176946 RepID=A0A9F5IT55_PYTBI|nr:sec1 family domain-containing protein 2-like [Python bivittatus]